MSNYNYFKVLDLLEEQSLVSMKDMLSSLSVSERKIRDILKSLREKSKVNGYSIITVSKEGYYLKIHNKEHYESYKRQLCEGKFDGVSNIEFRISLILFLLLQSEGYTSLSRIAETLDVSRNTIINDMEQIKEQLARYHILLESKPHYGVKVSGKEKNIRKMLSKISSSVLDGAILQTGFFEFVKELEFQEETAKLIFILDKYNISMTSSAIESVLFHLKILVYRILQNNYVSDIGINAKMIDEVFFTVSKEILDFISDIHKIEIPKEEVSLMASQICGKANIMSIESSSRRKMERSIYEALQKVDNDYATDFHNNDQLKENLLLHICPLIMRVSFDLELKDPLLGTVSIQYMNVFLIAMRFIDYHCELKNYKLSRDEIGYLTLHFAAIIEMQNQEKIQQVRRILLITDQMRSTAVMIKSKLQSVFPQANILEVAYSMALNYHLDDIELVIAVVGAELPFEDERLVLIDKNVSDHAIRRIKNKVLFGDLDIANALTLENLFFEDLFMIRTEGEYQQLITQMCQKMIQLGYAQPGLTESVLAREKRFTTVVDHGVAFPHSLIQMADRDSIGVVLLNPPILYEKNEIRCIFVLNIKKGHHFIQQDIGDFILRLMEDLTKVKRLQKSQTFKEFKMFLKKIVKE